MPRRKDYRKQAAEGVAITWSFVMKHSGDPLECYRLLRDLLAVERDASLEELAALHGIDDSRPRRRKLRRSVIKQVFERDAYRCCACGEWLSLTVDHIVPLARGGSDELANLQTLCLACNLAKGADL